MHRWQTLGETPGLTTAGLLLDDGAAACAAAVGAGKAKKTIGNKRAKNCFVMSGGLSSLQGFTFLYGFFTCDKLPARYHT